MESTWLAIANAALFVLQIAVNAIYAKAFVLVAREYETLITPASFAFALWVVVYALEAVFVCADVFVPQYSLFADANQPKQLRLCFAATCVANSVWVLLYASGHVYAATTTIFVLWLALLVLYIYAVNDRNDRMASEGEPFDWPLYLCNEVPISLYFAWVTTVAFTHLALAMQHSAHDYLRLSTYVSQLSIVLVMALLAAHYAQDAIFGLVVIWYFIGLSVKHVQFPPEVRCLDIAVRACAGQGAAVIAAVLVIGLCQTLMDDRYVKLAV